MGFAVDQLIAFSEDLAPFGVTDNDVITTDIFKQRCGNFAGESSGGLRIAVLSGNFDVGFCHGLGNSAQRSINRANNDFDITIVFHGRNQTVDEFGCFAKCFVQLPVACDHGFAHFILLMGYLTPVRFTHSRTLSSQRKSI